MGTIIAIIGAILGTGGITALLTVILSARKYKAEARAIEQQYETARREGEERINQAVRQQMLELSQVYKKDSDELRKQTVALYCKINELNGKIQELMNWIAYDNAKYRGWLETELIKLNPDIQFPECRPAPKFLVEPTVIMTDSDAAIAGVTPSTNSNT